MNFNVVRTACYSILYMSWKVEYHLEDFQIFHRVLIRCPVQFVAIEEVNTKRFGE
jgi:hypothetical protein